MQITEIIEKKKRGQRLSAAEIDYFVMGYTKNRIPDYQISALLMAIWFQGMTEEETFDLTMSMMHSGDVLDLSFLPNTSIDKHSTGGIGDKITLIVAPLWKSMGLTVAKMSGRGLGFTGGTIDKLESIPKMRVQLGFNEFLTQVKEEGIAVTGQSKNLAPADKILYALRDVTETVDSLPLIASSVMSKKLATGSDILILDVKYGSGAFMKTYEDAKELAVLMLYIGKRAKRKVAVILSPMSHPLGYAVGNSLEVLEALEVMEGKGNFFLSQEAAVIGGIGIYLSGKAKNLEEGIAMAKASLNDGSTKRAFLDFVRCQGGDVPNGNFAEALPLAKNRWEWKAKKSGVVSDIDGLSVGLCGMELGAGRKALGDSIDYGAGIRLAVSVGDKVKEGELLAVLYSSKSEECILEIADRFEKAITIAENYNKTATRCDLLYEDKVIALGSYFN